MTTLETMLAGMWCGVRLVGVSTVFWALSVVSLVALVGTATDASQKRVRPSRAVAEAP